MFIRHISHRLLDNPFKKLKLANAGTLELLNTRTPELTNFLFYVFKHHIWRKYMVVDIAFYNGISEGAVSEDCTNGF
jgi:hypothetical protein